MTSSNDATTYKSAPDSQSETAPSGERSPAGPDTGRDPKTGQFTAGNSANLRHGLRSRRHLERLQDQAAEAIAEQRDEITADLGGEGALSRVQQDLLERYLAASCLLLWMEAELVAKGPVTAKGSRRALHNAYTQQLEKTLKIAGMLGLEKKSKGVSLAEHMRRKEQEP